MTQIVLPNTITPGALEDAADVQENDEALRDGINGNLDGFNLTQATRERLGLSDTTTVRAGKSVIAASESTSSATFVTLTTADQVANVFLPTAGLLYVTFAAQWFGDGNTQAAIFLGVNQAQGYNASTGAVAVQQVAHPGGGSPKYQSLYTSDGTSGLASSSFSADAGTRATTGFVMDARTIRLTAVAGTYTVSVRFRNTGGVAMTVRDRLLFVESRSF